MLNAKRKENESYKKYKKRMKNENFELRQYLKGRFIWTSTIIDRYGRKSGRGTYNKKIHGPIGSV